MRYFLEVSYKGTAYAGFQIQKNANTVQGEVEKALQTVFRKDFSLTGSSRTDTGVHALQNFFHFDTDFSLHPASVYNLNAVLPLDISVKTLRQVADEDHCRFNAYSRSYKYYITKTKNPFVTDTAWFYPYSTDLILLNKAADILSCYTDYTSFSKRNTQVKTNECTIMKSEWFFENDLLVYNVVANRFLRGMVRGLVATMLLVGRKKISVADFKNIIESKQSSMANFASPGHGLFLVNVHYQTP